MSVRMIVNRLGGGLLVLWLVTLLTFLLVKLIPGDPARVIAGERATVVDVERIRAQLGLNKPLYEQYIDWLGGVMRGDLGKSLYTNQNVASTLLDAAPPTLVIALGGVIVAVVIGVSTGIIAGLSQGTWMDRAISSAATLGIAIPNFWVGMLLVSIFALTLKWLPATAYAPMSDGLGPWLSHLVLPCIALGLATAAELARHTRGCVMDVLARPYVRTARSRGVRGIGLIRKHIIRNASIPVITVLGLQASRMLGGTIVIETVFGISGLGSLAINSVLSRDYPVIQGYVLFVAVIVVMVNLTVDFTYGWINPKVRLA